jgi:hypothetical protein
MTDVKLEKKNLVIFFPWSKEDLELFRMFKSADGHKQKDKEAALHKIAINVSMVDELLKNMKFEDHLDSSSYMLGSYIDEDDWKILKNRNTVLGESDPRNPNWMMATMMKMHCHVNSNCRGWIIDLKNLIFYRMNDAALEFFKGNLKAMKSFEELEKFIEDFKFRFAAKKFGI